MFPCWFERGSITTGQMLSSFQAAYSAGCKRGNSRFPARNASHGKFGWMGIWPISYFETTPVVVRCLDTTSRWGNADDTTPTCWSFTCPHLPWIVPCTKSPWLVSTHLGTPGFVCVCACRCLYRFKGNQRKYIQFGGPPSYDGHSRSILQHPSFRVLVL